MTEKIILSRKEVISKSCAAILRLYWILFVRDIFKDNSKLLMEFPEDDAGVASKNLEIPIVGKQAHNCFKDSVSINIP